MRMSWCLLLFAAVLNASPSPQETSIFYSTSGTSTSTSSSTSTSTSSSTSTSTSSSTSQPGPTNDAQACAQIASSTSVQIAQNSRATPTVSAQLAYDCLQSVPNKPEPAAALVKSLKAFVQWQSTLAFLKDPPASYMLPATDIEGGLDNISTTATNQQFKSEYEFQLSMVKLITTAHDGHFSYRPDVFKAFVFRNNLSSDIVSISTDGKAVPKLYHAGAVLGAMNGTMTNAPAITKINGVDAAKYIEEQNLEFSSFQDPDSQWNSVFRSYANPQGILTVAASIAFQGPSVTLTYDNGEEKTEDSFAVIRQGVNFTGVNSGEDYYTRFCTPPRRDTNGTGTPTMAPTPSMSRPAILPTIQGYPAPIVRDNGGNTTSGYFLNGTGYDNVAVLAVSAFAPQGDAGSIDYLSDFQRTVGTFLEKSKAAGKTKLIIDVQANGGGFVIAGYELFAQLFPTVKRFQADNIRLADSVASLARVAGSIPNNFTAKTSLERAALNVLQNSVITSNIEPGGIFTPSGKLFTTTEEIIAPVTLKGDRFTAYQQAPLNDTSAAFNLTGTGSRSNPLASVFAPENVVLLTDGTCGSTCTIFSYLMILQMNIKTTVVGGRPNTGTMQSIAGVEGAQVFPLNEISQAAAASIILAPSSEQAALKSSELGVLAEGYALRRLSNPANPGAVNGKNAFAATDSKVPLQFLYEPANCRIYFTAKMLMSPEMTWKKTVDATWTDPNKFCVDGSVTALSAASAQSVDPVFQTTVDGMGSANRNGTTPKQGTARGLAEGRNLALAVLLAGVAGSISLL
ncbi:uncharacterized protein L3040_001720 [Drepanopeziza brunnea f. sp. 'multigermtubi']|uniref:uncharacterized protein n=1 Tax=Drepanopeziza brunnea f. sp. 'multigermtubi' TaxID=698441 RepID=UPI00238BD784|nr:hypothetical protein L3040_001720 [Drepanopeziza brunnea f. sp. 'multigermtubi']